MSMLHGIFFDPEYSLTSLHNKGALLRQDPDTPDHYLAQFDALHLWQAYDWHSYPKDNFIKVYSLGDEPE